MEIDDVTNGLGGLARMDENLLNIQPRVINGHSFYFSNVRIFLKTQIRIISTIIFTLQKTDQEEKLYICRNCGTPYEGVIHRTDRDSTKCEVCGSGPTSFRAAVNWNLML